MALIRLAVCVIGVYAMFLIWGIAQERLSAPFPHVLGGKPERFRSVLLMNTTQSAASAISALLYMLITRKSGQTLLQTLGLGAKLAPHANGASKPNGVAKTNGAANGSTQPAPTTVPTRVLLGRFLQCAVLITCASPFGFAALSHISYPTMVLGKSCKLVPVMLMNVVLYRRKFAPYKYLVVATVTAGITIFMYMGNAPAKHKGVAESSLWGLFLLLINLLLDGAVNSTQDEIFTKYKVSGQQMMLWINTFSTAITVVLMFAPLPHIPTIHPGPGGVAEWASAMDYVRTHPDSIIPLLQFAFTGAIGQLFIFETLQHFGSLTLVTITLTRKLFTMILSVVVYKHRLTLGQWAGAAIVFLGISIEAYVKRQEIHAKRVIAEKEKAKIKDL
ncbi:UDP-galactose transporter [Ceratobasidium sp. AG-Ba]|nr:UDP-galactose transporter [Ceratobasidium sp. AG-Ba]